MLVVRSRAYSVEAYRLITGSQCFTITLTNLNRFLLFFGLFIVKKFCMQLWQNLPHLFNCVRILHDKI